MRHGIYREATATIRHCAFGLLIMGLAATSTARAEDWLGQTTGGEGGGRFSSRCHAHQFLVGAEARVGDLIDAIRPICSHFKPGHPTLEDQARLAIPMVGGRGGQIRRVTCPAEAPVVTGMSVVAQHERGLYVDAIHLTCGAFARVQPGPGSHRPILHLASRDEWKDGIGVSSEPRNRRSGDSVCPEGFLAAGLHGRYGNYIDAVGIVCTRAPVNSDAVCGDYRKVTEQQTRDNAQKRCGFTGPRWSSNADNHYFWCRDEASAAQIASERSQRDADLKQCQARLDANAGLPKTVPAPKRPTDIYTQPPKVTPRPADGSIYTRPPKVIPRPADGSIYTRPSGRLESRRKCPPNMIGEWPACKCPPKLMGPNCDQVVVN
jgi:hypothetical protein